MYVFMYLFIYVHVYTYEGFFVYILSIYIYIYIHIFVYLHMFTYIHINRLKNFDVTLDPMQTSSGNVFLYKAAPIGKAGPQRYFSRLVSFTADVHSSDAESLFVEALDNLGLVIGREEASRKSVKNVIGANHVFLNLVAPDTVVNTDFFDNELRRICTKYWYKMNGLAVTTVEMKLSCRLTVDAEPLLMRFIASNPTGFVLKVN
jgi:hypothetical protein